MWPDLVMNILKAVVGFSGDEDEVKVHVDMQPRDEIVVYCETTEGEVGQRLCFLKLYISIASLMLAQFQPVSD